MATFFGSEALVQYSGFFTAVSSSSTIYTVPSGYYAKITFQKIFVFDGNGGINGTYKVGPYDPIVFNSLNGDSFNTSYELFEGQSISVTVTGVTGTANIQFTWILRLYAAP